MSLFARPEYVSETQAFIQQLKAYKPTLEAEQRAGRGLLWDKTIDRQNQADFKAARVPQKPYVYLSTGNK
jgi:hypothetical protein